MTGLDEIQPDKEHLQREVDCRQRAILCDLLHLHDEIRLLDVYERDVR